MPTSKQNDEPAEGGGGEVLEKNKPKFNLRMSRGFKKYLLLVETLALLTSPIPLSFINNEGGNYAMAETVKVKKKIGDKEIKENAKDAAYALLSLFKTGNELELAKLNQIFNTEINGQALKYNETFKKEFLSVLEEREEKDSSLKKFLDVYRDTHNGELEAREFVQTVAMLYDADSYEGAVGQFGEELTNAFITFSVRRMTQNIVKLYVEALEDFDKLSKNIKQIDSISKRRICGMRITEYEQFGKTYSKLFDKKIMSHPIFKEYYEAYTAYLETKGESPEAVSTMDILRAIDKAIKLLEEGPEGKKKAKEKYGILFLYALGKQYVSKAESIAPTLEEVNKKKADIADRYFYVKKDLKQLRKLLKDDLFQVLAPVLEPYIAEWEMANEKFYQERNEYYEDVGMLTLIEESQKELADSVVSRTDLGAIMKTTYFLIDVAQSGDPESHQQLAKVQKELNDMKVKNKGKYEVLNTCLEELVRTTNPDLYVMISSINEDFMFEKLMEIYMLYDDIKKVKKTTEDKHGEDLAFAVRENIENIRWLELSADERQKYYEEHKEDIPYSIVKEIEGKENPLAVLKSAYEDVKKEQKELERLSIKLELRAEDYGNDFVLLAKNATWLEDPAKASYDYVNDVVETRVPGSVALALMKIPEPVSSLKIAYEAVKSEDEKELKAAEEVVGPELLVAVNKNLYRLEWLETANDIEIAETVNARLLFESSKMTFKGTKKTTFIENAFYLSSEMYTFYHSLQELLTPGIYNAADYLDFVRHYDEKFNGNMYPYEQFFDFEVLSQLGVHSPKDIVKVASTGGLVSVEGMKQEFVNDFGMPTTEEFAELYPDLSEEELQLEYNQEQNQYDNEMSAFGQLISKMNVVDLTLFDKYAYKSMLSYGHASPDAFSALGRSIEKIMENDPYLLASFLVDVVPAIAKVSDSDETFILALTHVTQLFEMRQSGGAQDYRYSAEEMRPYFKAIFKTIANNLPDIMTELHHKMLEDELRWETEVGPYGMPISPNLYKVKPGWWEEKSIGIPYVYGAQGLTLKLKPEPKMPLGTYMPYGSFPVDSGAINHFNGMWYGLYPPVKKMPQMKIPSKFQIGAVGAATIIKRLTSYFGPMPANYSNYWMSNILQLGAYYSFEKQEYDKHAGAAALTGVHKTPTGGVQETLTYLGGTTEPVTHEGEVAKPEISEHDLKETVIGGAVPMFGAVPLHKIHENFEFEGTKTGGEYTKEEFKGLLDSFVRVAKEQKTDMLVFVSGSGTPELLTPVTNTDANSAINAAQDHIDAARAAGQDVTEMEQKLTEAQAAYDAENYAEADSLARGITGAKPLTYQDEEVHLRSKLYFVTQKGDVYQLAYGKDTETQLLNYFYGSADTEKVLASLKFSGEELFKQETKEGAGLAGFDGLAVGATIGPFAALGLANVIKNLSTMEPIAVEQAVGAAVQHVIKKPLYKNDIFAAFYRGSETLTVHKDIDPVTAEEKGIYSIAGSEHTATTIELMWRHIPPDPKLDPAWELRVVGGAPLTVGAQYKMAFPSGKAFGVSVSYTEVDFLKDYIMFSKEAEQLAIKTQDLLVKAYGWKESDARNAGFFLGGSYLLSMLEKWENVPDEEQPEWMHALGKKSMNHYASLLLIAWAEKNNFLIGGEHVPYVGEVSKQINQAMTRIQSDPEHADSILKQLQNNIETSLAKDVWRFSLAWGYDGKAFSPYVVGGVEVIEEGPISGNLYALMLFGEPHKGYPAKAYLEVTTHLYGYKPTTYEPTEDGYKKSNLGQFNYADVYFGVGSLGWPAWGIGQTQEKVAFKNKPADIASKFKTENPELTGDEMEAVMKENKYDLLMAVGALNAQMTEAEVKSQMERWSIMPTEALYESKEEHSTFYIRVSPRSIEEDAPLTLMVGTLEDYQKWVNNGLVLGADVWRATLTKEGMTLFGDKKLSALESFKVIGGVTLPISGADEELYTKEIAGGKYTGKAKYKAKGWSVGGLMHIVKTKKADILGGALYGVKEFGNEKWEGWTVSLSGKFQLKATTTTKEYLYGYLFLDQLGKSATFVSTEEEALKMKEQLETERTTGGIGLTWVKVSMERGEKFKLHFFFEAGVEKQRNIDLNILPEQTPLAKKFIGRLGFKAEKTVGHGLYTWFVSFAAAAGDWPYMPATITQPEYLMGWDSILKNQPEENYWFMISVGIHF